ncbi:MAG: hypothetical protein AAGG56_15115 [Pseudomonadota bacterium]
MNGCAGDFSVYLDVVHDMNHDQINTAIDMFKAGDSTRSMIRFQPREAMAVNSLPGQIVLQ